MNADLVAAVLSFLALIISAVFGFISSKKQRDFQAKQSKQEDDQKLRADLMALYESQSEEIRQLHKEMFELRKENAHIIEQNAELRNALSNEKEKNLEAVAENVKLRTKIEEMQKEKAALADRLLVLESELYDLRKKVDNNERTNNESRIIRPS